MRWITPVLHILKVWQMMNLTYGSPYTSSVTCMGFHWFCGSRKGPNTEHVRYGTLSRVLCGARATTLWVLYRAHLEFNDSFDKKIYKWPSRSFWPFWPFDILEFSRLVLETGVIDLDLSGHLVISTQDSKKRRPTSLLYTKRHNVVLLVRSSAAVQIKYYIHLLYHALICPSFSICKSWLLEYTRWYHKRSVHRQRINVGSASCCWPNNSAHSKATLNKMIDSEWCKS